MYVFACLRNIDTLFIVCVTLACAHALFLPSNHAQPPLKPKAGKPVALSAVKNQQDAGEQSHIDHSDGDPFEEVRRWLISQGATAHEGVHGSFFPHGGVDVRGLLTNQALPEKAELLVIPKKLWLVLSNFPKFAVAQLPASPACQHIDAPQLKLAAALAMEVQKGNSSFYAKYIKHLPTMNDFHSFFPRMAEAPLQADFAALPLIGEVQGQQADDRRIQACFDEWRELGTSPARSLQWEPTLLGLTWLRTRACEIFPYTGTPDEFAIIPGYDMLNTAKAFYENAEPEATESHFALYLHNNEGLAPSNELLLSYCDDCDNRVMLKNWGMYMEDNPESVPGAAESCVGATGLRMKQVVEATLEQRVSNAAKLQRSPRCHKNVFDMAQGALRCSLARLAWETCAKDWGTGRSFGGESHVNVGTDMQSDDETIDSHAGSVLSGAKNSKENGALRRGIESLRSVVSLATHGVARRVHPTMN